MQCLCSIDIVSLILLATCIVQLCKTSTTEEPTTDMPSNYSTTPWADPKVPLRFTIAILEPWNTTYSFALPKVLPAVDLATDHVNQLYFGIAHFVVVYEKGGCDRDIVGVAAARISCSHNITAFVGPACSKSVETIAYMANNWNVVVITPIANTENVGDKKVFPRLTRINSLMQSSFVSTVFYMMKTYKWKHAVFFYDNDAAVGDLLGETFTNAFKETPFIWNSYELSGNTQDRASYTVSLVDAATRARVFILCMDQRILRTILLEAYNLGYSRSGGFVFLVIQSMSAGPTDATTWNVGNQTDLTVRESLAHVLFLHIDDSSVVIPTNFSREIRERAKRDYNYDYGSSQVCFTRSSLLSAFLAFQADLSPTSEELVA